MMLSSLCFALINIIVKILANSGDIFPTIQEYPVQELVFFRSVVSLIISFGIIKMKGIPFWGNNRKWLFIRGIAGVTALTLFFFTLKHLPIAISTTIAYLSPIFTVIFAVYLQGEKVRSIQWLFILVSLCGVAVLGYFKDDNLSFEYTYFFMGILSALIAGVSYNAIIKCRETDAPVTVVMYFPLLATPIMFIACLIWGYVVPQGIEWLLILAIGVLAQIAQVTMTRAFHADSAAKVTPIKYVGAIYAVTAGYFIFDEELGLYSSIGICLILLGVLLNTIVKQKKVTKS